MKLHRTNKSSYSGRPYLFVLERSFPLGGTQASMALAPDAAEKVSTLLMDMSDFISDQFWEQQGCDPDRTFWAPTLVQDWYVHDGRLMIMMGLMDRTRSTSAATVDGCTFWIPLDVLVGTGTTEHNGECTLGDIVDFLGSQRWEQFLISATEQLGNIPPNELARTRLGYAICMDAGDPPEQMVHTILGEKLDHLERR